MILRTLLCIPTYNNPRTIVEVVRDALHLTQLPILIVDDGSVEPVNMLLRATDLGTQIDQGRIHILRFEINQGKGFALQRAFEYAIGNGFTHLFSCDGDGQHLVKEVPILLEAAKENPWELIIGHRRLQAVTVPGISKFGRNFSNFWVRFQTGNPVADSQSGFRIYPLFQLQSLKFRTRRFDFEIEVLVKLLWKGVALREVDIDVHYPPAGERVSHFNKFWDNVYISILNTGFVVVSLLKSQRSPVKNGTAVGLGVLIGTTPFYGLHSLMAAAFSVLFRLNFTYLFIGTNIALPPFAPFLVFGSLVLGRKTMEWMNIPQDFTWPKQHSFHELVLFGKSHFLAWLVGSLVLGIILGLIAGIATFFASKRMNGAAQKPAWTGKTRGGKIGNGFLKFVLKHIGLKAGYFCLKFITPYFYIFAPQARKSLNEYWSVIAPEKKWFARQRQIVRHFYKFGQILMDRVYQNYYIQPKFEVRSEGFKNILYSYQKGKGCILMGAHMGGWDLAAALMETHEYREEVHVVEFQSSELSFQKVRGANVQTKVKSIDSAGQAQPVFEIYQALSKSRTVGMMGDRPLTDRYTLVPFFGKLAAIDVTPFQVAAVTKSDLLFTFGFKGEGSTYLFFASPSQVYLYDPNIARDLQCYQWATEFARKLESEARAYPDQWFNFFPFWSTPPKGTTSSPNSKTRHHLLEELNKPTTPGFA